MNVFAKVYRRHPRSDDFSAEAPRNIYRVNNVAQRFRHCLALWIERPSIGCNHTIRRLVARSNGAEQGRVEPAAVLVASFEIKIRWPGQTGFASQNSRMTAARLEPDVDDVHLFQEPCTAALRTFCSGRKQLLWLVLIPGIRSLSCKQIDNS